MEAESGEPSLLWRRCRESLGIARLLVNERRPATFVETACHLAVENACRAALTVSGRAYDGDLGGALSSLEAPADLWTDQLATSDPLPHAERAIAWLADHLKTRAPDRAWGY